MQHSLIERLKIFYINFAIPQSADALSRPEIYLHLQPSLKMKHSRNDKKPKGYSHGNDDDRLGPIMIQTMVDYHIQPATWQSATGFRNSNQCKPTRWINTSIPWHRNKFIMANEASQYQQRATEASPIVKININIILITATELQLLKPQRITYSKSRLSLLINRILHFN
jgi:hypothetical protein